MGRRKKDDVVSYVQIVSSSYVQNKEYQKAQIAFSSALDDKGNLRFNPNGSFLDNDDVIYDENDDIFD